MPAKILACKTCRSHPFQDEKYGTSMRVHSQTCEQDGKVWRCTVCSTTRSYGDTDDPPKGKKK